MFYLRLGKVIINIINLVLFLKEVLMDLQEDLKIILDKIIICGIIYITLHT